MLFSQMAYSLTLWRAGSAAEDKGTSRADLKESRPERVGLLSETSRQCCHVLVHIFYLRKKPLHREMCSVCVLLLLFVCSCMCMSSDWNALIEMRAHLRAA